MRGVERRPCMPTLATLRSHHGRHLAGTSPLISGACIVRERLDRGSHRRQPLATSLCHQPLAISHQPLPPASATSLAPRGTRTAYTADTAPHAPPPPTEAAAACAEENQPSLLSTDTPDDHTSSTGLSKLHAPPPLTPHHTAPHHYTATPPPHHTGPATPGLG